MGRPRAPPSAAARISAADMRGPAPISGEGGAGRRLRAFVRDAGAYSTGTGSRLNDSRESLRFAQVSRSEFSATAARISLPQTLLDAEPGEMFPVGKSHVAAHAFSEG
ncbi:conserved hypothetical protein [Burkholderia pseudomallei 668]|nr:conserved hypothetical protein [Burkholderia pseudomallei 668]